MYRQTILMALVAVLVAGNALAQVPPPTTQTPPPAAPAPQVPAPAPLPPFPADAKIAFVDLQTVVSQSALGRAGSGQLEALSKRLETELVALNTKLKEAQSKQQTQSQLLSEVAASQLAKDIDRLTRELNFKQQEAQSEIQAMQADLLTDFERKVVPIMEAMAKEKGLYALFNVQDSGAVYFFPGLNLSPELVKRVDTQFPEKK